MNIFLIDADNLNSGPWLDEAFRQLQHTEGSLSVRRAYGSADSLKALADTLCQWAVRPCVNLALTKNTTDIALAVDAMALACQTPAPRLIVIGSGDADFVPLVVRLRERGIRVVCVSERSKMGREAVPAYDQVILVGPEALHPNTPKKTTRRTAPKTLVAPAAPSALLPPTPTTQPLSEPMPMVAPATQIATGKPQKPASKKVRQPKATPALPAVVVVPVPMATAEATKPAEAAASSQAMVPDAMATLDVAAILQAMPALQTGQPQPLAAVAKVLLDARLRGKNMTSTKLLKKFATHFVLAPPEKPRTVQYLTPQDAP